MKQAIEQKLDLLNAIEIYPIRLVQKVFFVEQFSALYQSLELILSPENLILFPLLLFSINCNVESLELTKSIVFYLFLTYEIKNVIFRKRPYYYQGIVNNNHVKSSSFPSNHVAGSVIVACALPTQNEYIKIFFVMIMILNRMILGCHFLTDTLAGVVLELFLRFISAISNRFITIICIFCFMYRNSYFCSIYGASLALLLFPRNKQIVHAWVSLLSSFVVYPFLKLLEYVFSEQIKIYRVPTLFSMYFLAYVLLMFLISLV